MLRVAERIVGAASRDHPVDALLRQELRAQRELTPAETTQISRLVFAYFRWRGWLGNGPLDRELARAAELAEKYADEPQTFDDAELINRCVPDWLKAEMEVTPAWARSLQSEPKLWLRARPGQGSELAGKLGNCAPVR